MVLTAGSGNLPLLDDTPLNDLLLDSRCEMRLHETKAFLHTRSRVYRLWCADRMVEKIEVVANSAGQGRSDILLGVIPNEGANFLVSAGKSIHSQDFAFRDRYAAQFDEFRATSLVLCPTVNGVVDCWLGYGRQRGQGILTRLLIDHGDGRLLSSEEISFDFARVYSSGPQDEVLVETQLENIGSDGYLDGTYFSVFAPGVTDPRAFSPSGEFTFEPDTDTKDFDQVQSYYGASVARRWFVERFSFDDGETKITIRVHDRIAGSINNAAYEPDSGEGPQIRLGAGDGQVMANISRDGDVIAHEYSHHIIYQRLKTSRGEAGLIHEGYADYFAYAIRDNPFLGESVKVGEAFLRTAELDPTLRFDDPRLDWAPHQKSQFISAVLWDVRKKIGADMDAVVFRSIDYFVADSGLRDAFSGLLRADNDLFSDSNPVSENGGVGKHHCAILEAAIARGFSAFLDELDGGVCNLNLASLASESRQFTQDHTAAESRSGLGSMNLFGKPCGVLAAGRDEGFSVIDFLVLLLVPVGFGLLGVIGKKGKRADAL